MIGDSEESEEHESSSSSSLSLHEDISFSSISVKRLWRGDEVATREESGDSATELGWSE